MDPVGYIRALGLQPEDSYGFLPTRVEEGATMLFLYRDRPEYEERRPKLSMPVEATGLGPVEIQPTQRIEMQSPESDPGAGAFGDVIAQAQELQAMYGGGGQGAPLGDAGDVVSTPDPERLVRLAKLLESGAITPEEYQRMVTEEATPTTAPAGEATGAPSGGAAIVAH